MSRAKKPTLTPEMVADDGPLTEAIPGALTSPQLGSFTEEVLRRQTRLRDLLSDEQWRAYLDLEEKVNHRVAAESLALVRWAWREGRRVGRREARGRR